MLIHVEGWILMLCPIIVIVAVILDFSSTNLILACIALLVWKIGNNALD